MTIKNVSKRLRETAAGQQVYLQESDMTPQISKIYQSFQEAVKKLLMYSGSVQSGVTFRIPEDEDGSVENGIWNFEAVLPKGKASNLSGEELAPFLKNVSRYADVLIYSEPVTGRLVILAEGVMAD